MSGIRIDEQLNLVLPVDRPDGSAVWVHAAPVSREVFQQHYLVMARVFTALATQGIHPATIPTIAPLMFRDEARALGQWEVAGGPGPAQQLLAEIRRLANVVVPAGPGQPQYMPLDVAVQRGVLDAEDADQVTGVLVFFSLTWRLLPRKERRIGVDGAASAWDASTSSLSLTAFGDSLRTSSATGNTGETAPAA